MDRYLMLVPKYLIAIFAELALGTYVTVAASQRLIDRVSNDLHLGLAAAVAACCIWAAALVSAHSFGGLYKPDFRTFAAILLGTALGSAFVGRGAPLPLTYEVASWIVGPGILGALIARKPYVSRDAY